jgi:hypothetical protein
MLENLQQSQQLKSILCKGSSIGNESPQPRIVTVDFVNTALGLLQPAFGAISCRVDSEPGKSPKSANHVANSPHSTVARSLVEAFDLTSRCLFPKHS